MARFKDPSEPFVYDFKELLKALSGKEAVAQSEVDAFMENCTIFFFAGSCLGMSRAGRPSVS